MEQIRLELPEAGHKNRAEAFKQEFIDAGEPVINGSALLDQMEYEPWLEHTVRCRQGETVPENWVQATTFFAVREADGEIVGMIDIRHTINHPFLKEYGGHIGYAVRPSQRRRGIATRMLELALDFARSVGLNKVMLGCYQDNAPSARTIVKCGGTLAETKPYADGKPMNLYWITLL